MINFIHGELAEICENNIVLENNGMGFEINTPRTVHEMLPSIGEAICLYTYFQVKEDGMALFGFLEKEDLTVFKLLISVNGIGPKGALSILSAITVDELRLAVLAGDIKAITKAPGIGAKTAGKLILELKDKFKLEDVLDTSFKTGDSDQNSLANLQGLTSLREDAVQALIALGYSNSEALKAVKNVQVTGDTTVQDIIKASFKRI